MTAELATARRLAFEEGRNAVLPAEPLPLAAAAGRTLAEPVAARIPVPPFATAARDGWIVAGPGPWRLGPLLEVGSAPLDEPLADGTARAVAAGAPVPPGAAALLGPEQGRVEHGQLTAVGGLRTASRAGVRPAASEAREGDAVLAAGALLTPARLAAAAAAAVDEVRVRRIPSVDLVVTGDELVPTGLPDPGAVRDALGPAVPALVTALGGAVTTAVLVGDGLEALERLARAAEGDLLLITGGTAAGPTDHVRDALEALGWEPVVDGVGMAPGRTALLARREDGRPVLCLPGDPPAALAALALVGGALLAGLLGRPMPGLRAVVAADAFPVPAGPGVGVVPARYDGWGVVPVPGTLLHGLPDAEVLAVVPVGGAARGDVLEALPL